MNGKGKSDDTPKKFNSDSGCVFCGSELTDSRKRTKLNGKVSDLPGRISSVLNVPLSSINVESYICNWTLLSRPKAPWKNPWRCKISSTIIARDVQNKQPNKTLCPFELQNFALSPCRRNRFATRRIKEGERLQNACHSQKLNQNQIPAQISYYWFGPASNCTFAGKKHFRWKLRGKYLSRPGKW